MRTINEEIKKIKHLLSYEKGSKTLNESSEEMEEMDLELDSGEEESDEIPFKEKMDDILFGSDQYNVFTPSGEYGYLSQENRLKKKVSPKQRKERIGMVISQLESYLDYLKSRTGEEDVWIDNPEYRNVWGDR